MMEHRPQTLPLTLRKLVIIFLLLVFVAIGASAAFANERRGTLPVSSWQGIQRVWLVVCEVVEVIVCHEGQAIRLASVRLGY
jgi:hypothetical protein